jgi:Dolichyl-phosphate-mannose-protein mannosyltransferase
MASPRAVALYLAASGCIVAFWVTAVVSDFFLDRPFVYTTADEWSSNFVRSAARFPSHAESGLYLVAGVFLLPAIICIAAALATHSNDPLETVWARLGGGSRQAGIALGVLAALFSALVSFAIVDGVDLIDDERSYLFQASLFAKGLVKLPAPPAALHNPMILVSPAWMGKYPPGHSAALLVGVLLHAPRVVPPMLAGLLVYFIYEFIREVHGERQAMLAASLLALSPFLWCSAATLMSFTTFTCSFVASLWLFARGRRTGATSTWVGSGALLGFALTVRPYDAVALGWPMGAWLLRDCLRPSPQRKTWLFPFAAGAAPLVAALLSYNQATTGSPLLFGYNLAKDYSWGFFTRPVPGFAYEHTPAQGIAQAATAIARLDMWLFGWPASLLLALAGAWAASQPFDRFILWILGSFAIAYTLLPTTGTWDVGPTYYLATAPLLVVLAVRGIRVLRERLRAVPEGARFVGWLPVAGAAVAIITIVPVHLTRLSMLSAVIDAPWRAVVEAQLGESIVVVPGHMKMGAAGYALGYPYEIRSGTGTAHLVRPRSQSELDEARQFLGMSLPVVQLVFDEEAFRRDGARHYQVRPLS